MSAPRPSTQHSLITHFSDACRAIARVASTRFIPAILGPLPDVAVDVVQTPGIWFKAVHGHRPLAILTIFVTSNSGGQLEIGLIWSDLRAPPKRGRCTSPCHIFALCFRQEPVGIARFFRQPLDVGQCIIPANIYNRLLAPTPALVIRVVTIAATAQDAGVPFRECDGEPPDRKYPTEVNPLLELAVLTWLGTTTISGH
jgi:hypothetical protein